MSDIIYPKPDLNPLLKVTHDAYKLLRIGEDFFDLSRLGLIGEYIKVEATDICPTLYYRWNYSIGIWEIYALEHDLIGFNLGEVTELNDSVSELDSRVSDLEDIVGPTEEPTQDPTEEPTEEPTEIPDYHSKISQDENKTGGDLEVLIDGGIITFAGKIKYYKANYQFPASGNYVGVTITPSPYLWSYYKNTLEIKYKGMTFGKDEFVNGKITFYVFITTPGQEVPIRFYWNEGVEEDFTVAVTQESQLELPDGNYIDINGNIYDKEGNLIPTDEEEISES